MFMTQQESRRTLHIVTSIKSRKLFHFGGIVFQLLNSDKRTQDVGLKML